MNRYRNARRSAGFLSFAAFTVLTITAYGGAALAQEALPGWSAHGALTLKGGTERHIGELDIFLPVWQDSDTLLFGDLRAQTDDDGNQEGNIGFGLRQLGEDWIVGGYAFFDHRKSDDTGNTFMQGTFGVEAMTEALDLRANFYIPESGEESTPGATAFDLVGTSLQMRAGFERALPGFDAEIGYRLMGSESSNSELRVFAGGYHFRADGYETVAGPRGRMEVRLFDVGFLGEGSRITLGAEVTHDDVRDTEGFAMARLTIPLGGGRRSGRGGLQRRMTDYVVRDVDVVTGSGATGAPEDVNYAHNGIRVRSVSVLDSTADLPAEAALRGAGDMIVVDGTGLIVTTAPIVLSAGEVLVGGGSGVDLVGASSGTRATYTAPGVRPVIFGGAPASSATAEIVLANDVIVSGLDVENIGPATGVVSVIGGDGVSGALVTNNNIRSRDREAIRLVSSDGNTVAGNSIVTAGTLAHGFDLQASSGNTLRGNSIVTAGDGAYGFYLSSGSTGNMVSDNSIVTAGVGAHGISVNFDSDSTFTDNAITTGQASAHGMFFSINTSGTGTGNSYSGPGVACIYLDIVPPAVDLCQ